MDVKWLSLAVLLSVLNLGYSSLAAGREAPVAKLMQVEGLVEYSRNGTEWKPVTATKYLFADYQLRTGQDGSGKLVNQVSGSAQALGASSQVLIAADGIKLISGDLGEAEQDKSDIFEGLSNKFATAQRYTTVRRSVTKTTDAECDSKVRTIRKVALSPTFPDLVWRNACPEYSYRLLIDGVTHEVAAQSTVEMIRFTVKNVTPGTHSYHVEVLDKDGTVYIPKDESTFVWLDPAAEASLMAKVAAHADDVFVVSGLLETNNFFIAAMDKYREYFTKNPDDNDMRPLLIQSYQDLKLTNLRESEARLYNAALESTNQPGAAL